MGCQKWSRGSPQTKEHMLGNPGTPQYHVPHGSTVPQRTQRAPVGQDKGNNGTDYLCPVYTVHLNCLCLNQFGQTTCIMWFMESSFQSILGAFTQ